MYIENVKTRTHDIVLTVENTKTVVNGKHMNDGRILGGTTVSSYRVVSAVARRLGSDAIWDAEIVDASFRPVPEARRTSANIKSGLAAGIYRVVPVEEVQRRRRQRLEPFRSHR